MDSRRSLRLCLLGAGHLCVDGCATMIWPMVLFFAERHSLSLAAASLLPIFSATATSLVQPVMGYWSERGLPRWVALAGPGVAAVGIALAIAAGNVWWLILWLVVSGLGVAVYHPEAVVLAGDVLPARRSLGTALFMAGGTVGLAAGPILVPRMTEAFGPANSWLIAVGPLVIVVLLMVVVGRGHRLTSRTGRGFAVLRAFRGQMRNITLMVALNSLRGLAIAGVCLALTWLAKQRGGAAVEAGILVGVFTLFGGVGALLCGMVVVGRAEKPLLVLTMLAALPVIWVLPRLSGTPLLLAIGLAGLLSNATVPVVVVISQRMVPQGARLVSSLMMGFSWGIGAIIAAIVVGLIGEPVVSFAVMGLVMLPAAGCAALLSVEGLGGGQRCGHGGRI